MWGWDGEHLMYQSRIQQHHPSGWNHYTRSPFRHPALVPTNKQDDPLPLELAKAQLKALKNYTTKIYQALSHCATADKYSCLKQRCVGLCET